MLNKELFSGADLSATLLYQLRMVLDWCFDLLRLDTDVPLCSGKLLAEGVLQSLRENKYISLQNIAKICELLECQPADLLEFQKEE